MPILYIVLYCIGVRQISKQDPVSIAIYPLKSKHSLSVIINKTLKPPAQLTQLLKINYNEQKCTSLAGVAATRIECFPYVLNSCLVVEVEVR